VTTPSRRWFALLALSALLGAPAVAADAKPGAKKRVLLVTHSGGFIHDSVGVSEDVLKKLAPENNLEVTCYRFTGDPEARVKVKDKKDAPERETTALEAYSAKFRERTGKSVEAENCGRINKETLKNFDAVIFFTTGDPVTKGELADLLEWVKAGGAFAGTHCGTDTLYSQPAYGEMIGAYFRTHPPGLQKVTVKVEDAKHPAAAGFNKGGIYEDEIYIFKDAPYSRDKLHIILSADGFKPTNGKNPGGWYPEQRITVAQAVEAYTLGSAYAAHQEADRGTLAVGKLADFVVLDQDIFDAKEIGATKPTMTVVGGKVVYERK